MLRHADWLCVIDGGSGGEASSGEDPREAEIVSRFELPKDGKGEVRARPVVYGGRLYIRHDQIIYVYDVRAK